MSATRESLELALIANPEDVALHSAYADCLLEEGDPRGEYIQLQLALEDRNQSPDTLRAMEQRAFELRQKHERTWLGLLATFVYTKRPKRTVDDMVSENVTVTWKRGWVHGIEVHLGSAPVLRSICDSPNLGLMARFEMSSRQQLRIHELFHAVNLPSLRDLTLHLPNLGDEGLDALLSSPMFPRLRGLDLSRCDITDDGAQTLANHPHTQQLEFVRLDGNHLSAIGIEALEATGVEISAQEMFGYDFFTQDAE